MIHIQPTKNVNLKGEFTMGKFTVYTCGNGKVKIDTADSIYSDKKDPHVSIESRGTTYINHLDLYSIGSKCADRSWPDDVQRCFEYVQNHADEIIREYKTRN